MTSNFDDFRKKLRDFSVSIVPKRLASVQRSLALIGLRKLVEVTPVDTGRARANWQVGNDNVPAGEVGGEIDKRTAVITRERPTIQAIQPFSKTAIVNNVPYIERLENGSSKQAPYGMLGTAFEVVVQHAERAAGLTADPPTGGES